MNDPDRIKRALVYFMRTVFSKTDYYALYPCRVVSQNSDGTLELLPDNAKMPSLSGVPMRLGIPGVSITVSPGARVLLGFAEGNPQNPIATLWESGSVLSMGLADATSAVMRVGDSYTISGLTAPAGGGPVTGTATVVVVGTGSKVKA